MESNTLTQNDKLNNSSFYGGQGNTVENAFSFKSISLLKLKYKCSHSNRKY